MKTARGVVFAAALALAAGSAAAQTKQPAGDRDAGSNRAALGALQAARVTLGSLTEESMTRDTRQQVERISDAFRTLYEAYTGHAPDERKSTSQAAAGVRPAVDWRSEYDVVKQQLDAMLGPGTSSATAGRQAGGDVSTHPAPVGTVGRAQDHAASMSQIVRDGLLKMRTQLQQFAAQAGGADGH
jgi:hypothetical protein